MFFKVRRPRRSDTFQVLAHYHSGQVLASIQRHSCRRAIALGKFDALAWERSEVQQRSEADTYTPATAVAALSARVRGHTPAVAPWQQQCARARAGAARSSTAHHTLQPHKSRDCNRAEHPLQRGTTRATANSPTIPAGGFDGLLGAALARAAARRRSALERARRSELARRSVTFRRVLPNVRPARGSGVAHR